jgi:transposase
VATAYELAQRFAALLRERTPEKLDAWLRDAKGSEVAELRNFAGGLQRDDGAVLGALSLPWKQGQTEGQVNRLQFIKRMGYGQAKVDLLRLRVLYRPDHGPPEPIQRK